VSGRARRSRGELGAEIAALLSQAALPDGKLLALSGASGAHAATTAEKTALDANPAIATRGFSTLTGHMKEAQFPFAVALAALAVDRKAAYPVFDATAEKPFEGVPATVLATAIGYHQFEGMALVNAA
ncbi:MAG: beta-ketoacyl-ACP synthase, partial [Mesorhizobium sp.]